MSSLAILGGITDRYVHGAAEDDDHVVAPDHGLPNRKHPTAGHAHEVNLLFAVAHGEHRAERLGHLPVVLHEGVCVRAA